MYGMPGSAPINTNVGRRIDEILATLKPEDNQAIKDQYVWLITTIVEESMKLQDEEKEA